MPESFFSDVCTFLRLMSRFTLYSASIYQLEEDWRLVLVLYPAALMSPVTSSVLTSNITATLAAGYSSHQKLDPSGVLCSQSPCLYISNPSFSFSRWIPFWHIDLIYFCFILFFRHVAGLASFLTLHFFQGDLIYFPSIL